MKVISPAPEFVDAQRPDEEPTPVVLATDDSPPQQAGPVPKLWLPPGVRTPNPDLAVGTAPEAAPTPLLMPGSVATGGPQPGHSVEDLWLPPGIGRSEPESAEAIPLEPATIPIQRVQPPVSLMKAPTSVPKPPVVASPVPVVPKPEVQANPTLRFVSQILAIVAVLALGFLTQLTLFGGLQHARDQAQTVRELRIKLAIGTAPVGPLGEDGKPLPAGTPVAILEIPRLRLDEVVLEGSTSRVLMSGAGHRRDTVLPGQAGTSLILGRRGAYGGPFGGLADLRPADEIIVTTGQGRHTFTVLGVRRAGDPVPPPPVSGQGRLTLTTSDGAVFQPTDVLRVDANLTSDAQPAGVQIPSRALPENEAVMAGDSSALLPLMLWTPLLLAAAVGTVWVRHRAGRWQAWIIGVPVLTLLGVIVIDTAASLLPNVL